MSGISGCAVLLGTAARVAAREGIHDMEIPGRIRAFALVAAALLFPQVHAAAAVTTNDGAGVSTLSFTAPSPTIDCTTIYTLTGTAVMAITGPTGVYAGPVTIQGTVPRCSANTSPDVELTLTGSSDLGDFGCGTAASPMRGWWAEPIDLVTVFGSCQIAGTTLGPNCNFQFQSVVWNIPDDLTLTSWTDAGLTLWSGC